MKISIFFMLVLFSLKAFSFNPPSNIQISRDKTAVFVDFLSANYEIIYDVKKRVVTAKSIIKFKSRDKGFPVFDLVPTIKSIKLDGKTVEVKSFSMDDNFSKALYINKLTNAGNHTLEIENNITRLVKFNSRESGVSSAFWMSDLSSRRFLEQFLPSNLEYDQYQYSFKVNILDEKNTYNIMANGKIKNLGRNIFKIEFPKYFNASSVFYHLFVKEKFKIKKSIFTSIDGREIPITIYGKSNLQKFLNRTLKILPELEKDYGRWPHPSVVIYGAGRGGMEYCGATMTELSALGHELIHSYFARGVMPARGNAGWIDEAMASWRDSNYRQVSLSRLSKTKMAGHSIYRRSTDRGAYTKGRDFLGHLDKKFTDQGGLKPFMKKFHKERLFKPLLTQDFISDLTLYFNEDVQALFDTYIYGKKGAISSFTIESNPYHPKVSNKELELLL